MSYQSKFESSFLEGNGGTAAFLVSPITVLVVDDHTLIRLAIQQVLTVQPKIEGVVTVQDYVQAEEQATKLQPEIIWLDMRIGRADSIAEIRRLGKLSPNSRILALADIEDGQEAFAAIMAGAQGYRSKQDVEPGELMDIIQMLSGENLCCVRCW